MIELTQDQTSAIARSEEEPPTLIDPKTQTTYVLVPKEEYERLKSLDYDASPWTDEERDLLAAEVDAMLDDDMALEDNAP